jgi:colanic acid/amylovoran biosynthesis glycosyltransferase
MSTSAERRKRALALVAPLYPSLTETFVHREAEGLRERGWPVYTVSLHPVPPERRAADVGAADLTIYGSAAPATLARALGELALHPLRSLTTLGTALWDALVPGEPMSLAARLKVLGLSVLALGLAPRLRRRGVAHLHCHFANGPGTLGMYASKQLGVSFSFVGHANDLFDRRSLLRRKLERAAFVSCISEWHRDWYLGLCDRARDRYPVIRCGVDLMVWKPRAEEPSPARPLRVGAVARLIEKKGIDTLLRALAACGEREGIDWRLEVAGDGPQRTRLEALARALGCVDAVAFHGIVSEERVRSLMSSSHLLVLPSRTDRLGDRDGVPVVLMEAMALGIPVIAGDLPTIRELVVDDETGLLVEGNDVLRLSRCISRLAADPQLRRRLAGAARRRVEKEFSQEANLDRLEGLLHQAQARGSG